MLSLTQFVNRFEKIKKALVMKLLFCHVVLPPGIKSEPTKGMHDGYNYHCCVLWNSTSELCLCETRKEE